MNVNGFPLGRTYIDRYLRNITNTSYSTQKHHKEQIHTNLLALLAACSGKLLNSFLIDDTSMRKVREGAFGS